MLNTMTHTRGWWCVVFALLWCLSLSSHLSAVCQPRQTDSQPQPPLHPIHIHIPTGGAIVKLRAVEMENCVRLNHLSEAIMRCVLCARISFQAMSSNFDETASGKQRDTSSNSHTMKRNPQSKYYSFCTLVEVRAKLTEPLNESASERARARSRSLAHLYIGMIAAQRWRQPNRIEQNRNGTDPE